MCDFMGGDLMKIKRTIDIIITEEEQYNIARDYFLRHGNVLKSFLKGEMVHCPFPHECNRFPCNRKSCNADTLSDGHAYRQS